MFSKNKHLDVSEEEHQEVEVKKTRRGQNTTVKKISKGSMQKPMEPPFKDIYLLLAKQKLLKAGDKNLFRTIRLHIT